MFDVVLFANTFEIKIEGVVVAEGTTFTMMAKRFVVPSKLAALIRSNLADDGSLLRIKFNQSFQCLFHFGLFLEEVAR